MTVKTEWLDPQTGLKGISCLSSDTKPDAPAGSFCWETDTGARFERDGDNWNQSGASGAAHVSLQASGTGFTFPESWYVQDDIALTADAEYATSGDVSPYTKFSILLSTMSATTCEVEVSIDGGTNWAIAGLVNNSDSSTDLVVLVDVLYTISNIKINRIRVKQNGAGACTGAIAYGN